MTTTNNTESKALAKQEQAGKLATVERAKNYLVAKGVPEKDIEAFRESHDMFFGALTDPALSPADRLILAPAAVTQLRKAMSQELVEAILLPLAGSPLGFTTDRDYLVAEGKGQPYGWQTVRDCAIQAVVLGFPLSGNSWHIIQERFYGGKDGYAGLLDQVCAYSPSAKVPPIGKDLFMNGGYVPVPVVVKWKLLNAPDDEPAKIFSKTYQCRLNKKQKTAVEFLAGKAFRKAFKDLLRVVTGFSVDVLEEGETPESWAAAHGDEGPPDSESTPEEMAEAFISKADVELLRTEAMKAEADWREVIGGELGLKLTADDTPETAWAKVAGAAGLEAADVREAIERCAGTGAKE